MSWLKENRKFIDVPTDKGLGCALLSRVKYDRLASQCLEKSYKIVDNLFVFETISKIKKDIRETVEFALCHNVLHEKQREYPTCLLDKRPVYPRGRLLIKVHKPVVGARLIAAGTRWITNPLALLLAKFLQPMVVAETSIAKDSQDVLDALAALELNSSSKIATFDVEPLYPSMDPARVLGAIRLALTTFYTAKPVRGFGALIEVLCMLLQIVFNGQILVYTGSVSGKKTLYMQTVGITTGLACAVQLANLYLLGMDAAFKHTFSCSLSLYKRFVDDVLVVLTSRFNTDQLLDALNSFDGSIICTNDGSEGDKAVTFLDLELDITSDTLSYSTHRKPMATYNYTPYDSNHSQSTLLGIVATEAIRLLRTNCSRASFEFQRDFFMGKLKLRGFNLDEVRRLLAKYPWQKREELIRPSSLCIRKSIVPLKVPFSPNIHKLQVGQIFRSYEHMIPLEIRAQLRPLVAFETAPNLFRIRYLRFC